MKREFSTTKLYNLVKSLVNITTVLSLIWLSFLMVNYGKNVDFRNQFLRECDETSYGICLDVFIDMSKDYDNSMKLAATFGIGLPIVFYGAGVLYKYLFLVKIKKENEN